ncbi:MAG TPA: transglutaminase-like domain-containing protein [Gemmataceae bacterium]|nr:transglutaminase-like domain-containing protein [Gemmataceae bacterium]
MHKFSAAFLGLLLLTSSARPAGEATGKVVLDLWDAAFLQGARTGFVRTTVREYDLPGGKIFRASVELNLTLKRFKDTIQLKAITGTDETPDGKVVGVFMRQQLGPSKTLVVTGKVEGKQLILMLDGKHPMQPAPWDDRVVGLYRQQRMFQERKVKPGDRFAYPSFEPTVNLVVTTNVQVKDYEEVDVLGGKKKKRLLRVEATPDKIENVQLPTLTAWLGDDLTVQRSRVEVPGLGQLTLYRGTREQALTPAELAKLDDVGLSQLVNLNKRLPQDLNTARAVYRIRIKGEEDVATTFARDERQVVKNVKGDTCEIHVRASRGPKEESGPAKVGAEFTQSSYFITSDDSKVKEHARRAVGSERDAWKKALRIEKWVHEHMKATNVEALATADHVARTLEGDCTEYAMLTAAMCRAEGVPSRTAIGLVYAVVKGRPVMAFHMWTEVLVRGQWIPLDATLGRGHVGASHLKITDASWHNRRDLAPLLPVVRVLGKMSIEVLESQ